MKSNRAKDVADYGGDADWIDVDEYCQLAVSNRKLYRTDQPGRGVLGLTDPSTGKQYVIRADAIHPPF